MTCALHDTLPGYSSPCKWCAEAAGVVITDTPKRGDRPWVDRCPRCSGVDLRKNTLAKPRYRWCGACGASSRGSP